uniref:Uncharacterized protein n=1 Tax=Haptolina brevifila TaxID=156173 RepID=A0A7S2CYK7_9EUKA|mmetsp:Transcript_30714/g.61646  ORF Transcript_30714/g.61646 Transcript_30714/m.61646 type:complete len:307 (+) Transcript_30714:330-1250(+)
MHCLATYLARDAAIGADGAWLDNMGANVYGARSPQGDELRSFHLTLSPRPQEGATTPCAEEQRRALVAGNKSGSHSYAALLAYKDCAFSVIARQQAVRLRAAVATSREKLGKTLRVYGNGLKHSFYWTAEEMAAVREAHRRFEAGGSRSSIGTGGGSVGATIERSEAPPFSPDPDDRVVYFAVEGTGEIMQSAFDGFNMESFYGFIASRSERTCNRWPTMANTTLESCGFTFIHPGSSFWHANVRLMAHAAQHSRRALAKIGQAGWKTFAQELLPEGKLHQWVCIIRPCIQKSLLALQLRDRERAW